MGPLETTQLNDNEHALQKEQRKMKDNIAVLLFRFLSCRFWILNFPLNPYPFLVGGRHIRCPKKFGIP